MTAMRTDKSVRNEGWLLDRLGMLSCVVYFTYCIKKSICPRNPRGISSLIVGNPPSLARWRRITQRLGFVPTIVQLSSTVNICESLLFGSVDFWANAGFFSFSKQPTVFVFTYYFSFLLSKSKVLGIYPWRPCQICYNLARSF